MHHAFSSLCLAGLLVIGAPAAAPAQQPPDFQGRYIAAISDADMRAYAYIDGQIGEKRGTDALSLITLPLEGDRPTTQIEVPNSVINPVYSIAAAPDGDTIFVAETHTAQEPGDRTIRDLQPGTTLRAIDVSDLDAPRIVDAVEVGNRPLGVSVSPDGRTLVLATKTAGAPLTFVTFANGAFGEPRQFALENVSEMPELPDRGQFPHHAEWHPSEEIVAVTLNLRGQVQFYRVTRDDAARSQGLRSGATRSLRPSGRCPASSRRMGASSLRMT